MNNVHLIAIDPAKTKPTIGACFVNGKFEQFYVLNYKKIIKGTDDKITPLEGYSNVAVIEVPYIKKGHSIKNQIAGAVATGEISLWVRQMGYKVIHIQSWGNKKAGGWIQGFFGPRKKREVILRTAMQVCRADGIEGVKNDDYAVSYCLGKWWLGNNK